MTKANQTAKAANGSAKAEEVTLESTEIIVSDRKELVREIQEKIAVRMGKAEFALLTNETPIYSLKTRQGRAGAVYTYVDIGYVTEQLNLITGHQWSFTWELLFKTLDEMKAIGQVAIKGRLVIRQKNSDELIFENSGNSDIKYRSKDGKEFLSFGDDVKGAVSDCVKKCASMFGVAADVYSGAIARRQDGQHPDGVITEEQRKRLEVLATESGIGHSGLKKLIAKLYDYSSTTEIRRKHFSLIQEALGKKVMEKGLEDIIIPEDIKKGFDILEVPEAKQKASWKAYSAKGEAGVTELRNKISRQVDEKSVAQIK